MTHHHVDRRRLLRGAAAGTTLATLAALPAPAAATPGRTGGTRGARRTATLRWLGTAGWRVDIGTRSLLVDPYLTRFDTGLFRGAFNPATALTVDREVVAEHVGTPQVVLVTHSHWDHFNDVPHIATTTGARVVGTLTTYHLASALGVSTAQLSPVRGGEVLDFGDYTVEVVASLHSRNAAYSMAFPGVRLAPTEPARTIADLPEGDTLAFHVTVKEGPSIFFMGGSDFVARNVVGLTPDVAMIPLASSASTYDYVTRLVQALGHPPVIVPVHWDNFETPLQNPPPVSAADAQRLEAMTEAIRQVSPGSRIVRPEYLTPYTFG